MKLTLEAQTILGLVHQMQEIIRQVTVLTGSIPPEDVPPNQQTPSEKVQGPAEGPGPQAKAAKPPVDKPVDNPVDKPPAKKSIDRVAAMNKARAAKEAKAAGKAPAAPAQKSLDELMAEVAAEEEAKKAAPPLDPAQVVKIRQKTIEDLQSAYANGHQKEVFELLARFGNGAKSFRELPPEAFMPIRQAIDNGALT